MLLSMTHDESTDAATPSTGEGIARATGLADADLPVPRFAWSDMFVAPEDDPRHKERFHGERATLSGYLDDMRQTLALKCSGLDAEALARRAVPPSGLSLLGLVRHMAKVEQHWFRNVMAGQGLRIHYRTSDEQDRDFDGAVADPEVVTEAWETWRGEVAFANRLVAESPDLGVTGHTRPDNEPIELREVLVHMIEEYARHLGHADLLRERIDGRVGQ